MPHVVRIAFEMEKVYAANTSDVLSCSNALERHFYFIRTESIRQIQSKQANRAQRLRPFRVALRRLPHFMVLLRTMCVVRSSENTR